MPVIVMQPGVEMGGALLRRVKGTLAVGKPADVAMIDKDDPLGIDPLSGFLLPTPFPQAICPGLI